MGMYVLSEKTSELLARHILRQRLAGASTGIRAN